MKLTAEQLIEKFTEAVRGNSRTNLKAIDGALGDSSENSEWIYYIKGKFGDVEDEALTKKMRKRLRVILNNEYNNWPPTDVKLVLSNFREMLHGLHIHHLETIKEISEGLKGNEWADWLTIPTGCNLTKEQIADNPAIKKYLNFKMERLLDYLDRIISDSGLNRREDKYYEYDDPRI